MIDVDADQMPVRVEIENNARRHLLRFGAWPLAQIDIQRVRFFVIMQLQLTSSRNLRSKNALRTVSPSSSVTTLKYLPTSPTNVK